MFASEGIAVPMIEIARRANVGIGTVYRHFPTKEALFAAIVSDRLTQLTGHARALTRDASPGDAFFALLDRMVADGRSKKGLVDVLTAAGVDVRALAATPAAALRRALATLVRRAQAAGALRAGVTAEDVIALVSATLAAAGRPGTSVERLMAIVRDGLRAR